MYIKSHVETSDIINSVAITVVIIFVLLFILLKAGVITKDLETYNGLTGFYIAGLAIAAPVSFIVAGYRLSKQINISGEKSGCDNLIKILKNYSENLSSRIKAVVNDAKSKLPDDKDGVNKLNLLVNKWIDEEHQMIHKYRNHTHKLAYNPDIYKDIGVKIKTANDYLAKCDSFVNKLHETLLSCRQQNSDSLNKVIECLTPSLEQIS